MEPLFSLCYLAPFSQQVAEVELGKVGPGLGGPAEPPFGVLEELDVGFPMMLVGQGVGRPGIQLSSCHAEVDSQCDKPLVGGELEVSLEA